MTRCRFFTSASETSRRSSGRSPATSTASPSPRDWTQRWLGLWGFPENRGTPKSSILIRFIMIYHDLSWFITIYHCKESIFWVVLFWETPLGFWKWWLGLGYIGGNYPDEHLLPKSRFLIVTPKKVSCSIFTQEFNYFTPFGGSKSKHKTADSKYSPFYFILFHFQYSPSDHPSLVVHHPRP